MAVPFLLRAVNIYPAPLHVVLTTVLDKGRNGALSRSYWIGIRLAEYGFPRKSLLSISVNRGNTPYSGRNCAICAFWVGLRSSRIYKGADRVSDSLAIKAYRLGELNLDGSKNNM